MFTEVKGFFPIYIYIYKISNQKLETCLRTKYYFLSTS